MINVKKVRGAGIIITGVILLMLLLKLIHRQPAQTLQELRPVTGDIQAVITSTAIVQPQNRLEIKPPINGRIDQILVKEGAEVKAGQMLVLMSSTERAALLDAARTHGPEEVKYWEDVYKPTALLSPINGEVIVSKDEPGQTVTTSDVVVVLSDQLIIQAQVDETDIGKVAVGQKVAVSLDAYPQIKVTGKVDHIYYESQTVNNVTIYQVDIVPDTVPEVFRSGMSATVNIVEHEKQQVMTLPLAAIKRDAQGGAYVLVRGGFAGKPVPRSVELGVCDEKNAEIITGLKLDDTVVIATPRYKAAGKTGTNPLMPAMRRR